MKTSTSLLPDADSAKEKEHPCSMGHSAGSVKYKNNGNRRVGEPGTTGSHQRRIMLKGGADIVLRSHKLLDASICLLMAE